jgi:hypothetical protein
MTASDLKKLRQKLPPSAANKIASETGYTISHVNMVLSGTRNNKSIIDNAILLALQHQADLRKKQETINSL